MRALVFDYDGVIVDSETRLARVAVDLLAESGVEAALHDLTRFVGTSGPEAEAAFDDWVALRLGDRDGVSTFNRHLAERTTSLLATLPPRPGVAELIRLARAECWKIGLATGADRRALLTTLRRMELHELFDEIVTAGEVARGKPAPDVYLEAARRLEVAPEDCVAIEDSLPGYTAAGAAGMHVIVCPCELTSSTEWPAGTRIVPSLEGLALSDL